ncbi:hypothetical protein LPJ73_001027 [Coemansia sp. RSA 2703]|nr:hypothetical protein LPJ73_001027 [Coemansia sp. RSA 2703]
MILRIELSAEDAKYIPSNSATVSRSRPADFDDLVEHVTRVSLREKRDAEKRELDIESKLKAAQDELNSVKNQMNDLQDNVNWYKDELDRMQQRSERHVENINGLQRSLHNRKCEIEELEEELEEYRRNDGYY